MLDTVSPDGDIRPFTRAYNDVMDEAAAMLSATEFKLFYILFRETEGYHRETVTLSLATIREKTGIKSPKTLEKALYRLAQAGYVQICQGLNALRTFVYALGERFKSWMPMVKNTRGEVTIQRQLLKTEGAEVVSMVKNTIPPGKKYHTPLQKIPYPLVKNTEDTPTEASQGEAPPDAKETLKERVKEMIKENGSHVPDYLYKQIEDQKGNVKYVEDEYQKTMDTLRETSPLAKEYPKLTREARRLGHDITVQREKLAIFEAAVGFMELDYNPVVAMEKAKALVREPGPARSTA